LYFFDRLLQDKINPDEYAVKQFNEKQDPLYSDSTEVIAGLGRIKEGL
jgi:hypothetical protein